MCRGKNTCSELGIEIERWSRNCPLPYPKWMKNQIDIFIDAVNCFISGNTKSCLSKLKEIQGKKITLWFIEHGQISGRHRNIQLKKPQPYPIDKSMRDTERSPKKLQNSVFERDGYSCRYCGCKLISQDFIRLFIQKLFLVTALCCQKTKPKPDGSATKLFQNCPPSMRSLKKTSFVSIDLLVAIVLLSECGS